MRHLSFSWWPRTTPITTDAAAAAAAAAASATTTAPPFSPPKNATLMNCCGLSRLIWKLKGQSKMLCTPATGRQSAFRCRYDPLSYSLNFDAGCGSFADEEYYYKFCAFSSRFAATPRNGCQSRIVLVVA